jgi:uncharacterized secreted protein with C-terminal beta-propeller domain
VERLEGRLMLDSGLGADASLAAQAAESARPSLFTSADEWKQYIIDSQVARLQTLLGRSFPSYGDGSTTPPSVMSRRAPPSPRVEFQVSASADARSVSGTNNQVAGVDEGDIVETDGSFLYILSGTTLKIVDARQPDALAIASSTGSRAGRSPRTSMALA